MSVWEKIKTGWNKVKQTVVDWVERVGLTLAIRYALSWAKAKHPDWPLPSEQYLSDFAATLIGVHTVRGVYDAIKSAILDYVAGRAGNDTKP